MITATELVRLGRLNQALPLLELGDPKDELNGSVLAETIYDRGDTDRAQSIAQMLVRKTRNQLVKAKCLGVLASCARDRSRTDDMFLLSQRAAEAAQLSGDQGQLAIATLVLLERVCDRDGFSISQPLAAAARRLVRHVGDPQMTARLHITFGRLEGRAGHFDRALRHFELGHSMLALAPNCRLQAAADLGHSSILTLTGDVAGAVDRAIRGGSSADQSGWSRGKLVAACNLAYLNLVMGDTDSAERQLEAAAKELGLDDSYDLVLLDTRAQLAMRRGDLLHAETLLRSRDCLPSTTARWYGLTIRYTLVRALLLQDKFAEARELALEGESCARQARYESMAKSFRLCVAEIDAFTTKNASIFDIFAGADVIHRSLETCSAVYLVLATSYQRTGDSSKVRIALGRADRALMGAANVNIELAAKRLSDSASGPPSAPAPPTLDSAVALLELAGHPHILGREAFAILEGAGCCTQMALLAVGAAGARAVLAAGWSDSEALAALERATPDDLTVLGMHRDETWQLLLRPRPDIDDHCTVAAVRKLVATARTLDRYRRDEQDRSALWPAEALDGDPESLWISEQSAELLSNARRIASNPSPVLITGETGTGKEMLARAIHRASHRAERPLQAFNCSAVPRDMLESQLFGHTRGAFTGADSASPGVIRAAAGGTLFLDEIAELNLELQPKLLRFLDRHEIHPLGEPHPIKVDVRVIAATNADVERLVAEGRFREDLFHRLNVIRLRIPPLRERREEIPPLVEHYLRRISVEQKKGSLSITDEVLEYLVLYNWTGNLRQLANEVRRMVAFADRDSAITPDLLSPEILASRRTIAASSHEAELRVRLDQPLPAAVDQLEQTMVRRALERSHGRVEEASRLLGISRKGLFLKRRRWGLREAS